MNGHYSRFEGETVTVTHKTNVEQFMTFDKEDEVDLKDWR